MNDKNTHKIKNNCERSKCPITNTLDIIGDKWTLLVIRDMLVFGKSQYNEFLESDEGISTNILADRLKKLEQSGVIDKKSYQTKPTRYEYHLTNIGKKLKPLLIEMVKWGGKHVEGSYMLPEDEIDEVMRGEKNPKPK